MKANKVGLLWLTHNLRLHDNAVFEKVNQCDRLLIVYVDPLTPPQGQCFRVDNINTHKTAFFLDTLNALNHALDELGQGIKYLKRCTVKDIVHLIKVNNVTDVYVDPTTDLDLKSFIEQVQVYSLNQQWHLSVTTTIFSEKPYQVFPKTFSQFRKSIETNPQLQTFITQPDILPPPTCLPPPLSCVKGIDDINTCLKRVCASVNMAFQGGEHAALAHVSEYFKSNSPAVYKQTRNDLSGWHFSTKLSAWLSNGSLSVRSALKALAEYEKQIEKNESTYWIAFELLWREFYKWYALEYKERLFSQNGINEMNRLNTFYPKRYQKWVMGATPYPIVNALMNQLRQTGYMSNRGRQIVASCFIHELALDWRYGASYFESQLIDYDVASNWGNWQYLAGVGADPRGIRQFNLDKQTQLYDPQGDFIKRWNGACDESNLDDVDAADWPVT